MSILEVIVLLIGFSVIAFLLYGAYRFWADEADAETVSGPNTKVRKAPPVPQKADWPIEAVSGRRPA